MARRRPKGRPPQPDPSEPDPRSSAPALSGRHTQTLRAIFERPTRADIPWRSIMALFEALGAEVTQGRGSRVRVALPGARAVFHEPRPGDVTVKGAVEAVRDFLDQAGFRP